MTIRETINFEIQWEKMKTSIRQQMTSRGYRAANELRNAALLELRGQRSGRVYTVPGTGSVKYNKRKKTAKITYRKYTASAPGEPPAVRTGIYRLSWQPNTHVERHGKSFSVVSEVGSSVKTDGGKHLLGEVLEHGTSRMAPRPHKERIQKRALPKVKRIYSEPYF